MPEEPPRSNCRDASLPDLDWTIMWVPLLEILEMVQRLLSIEEADVLRLGGSESAHCPAEVHEVRLDRRVHRVHADLAGQVVRLLRVARAARGYDIRPVVRSTT